MNVCTVYGFSRDNCAPNGWTVWSDNALQIAPDLFAILDDDCTTITLALAKPAATSHGSHCADTFLCDVPIPAASIDSLAQLPESVVNFLRWTAEQARQVRHVN